MKNSLKATLGVILTSALLITSALAAKAGHHGGGGGGSWPSKTAFTFNYNVGTTATNYHAYGIAGQVGLIPQPTNTVILVFWYVKDLGPVSGTGSVACPAELLYPSTGILLFANASDTGGDGTQENYTNPIPMVQVTSGTATIQIALPHDNDSDDPGVGPYPVPYNGPVFSPFGWDLTQWVWNVEPYDGD